MHELALVESVIEMVTEGAVRLLQLYCSDARAPEPMHGAQVAAAPNVLFDQSKSSVAIFIGKPIPRPDRFLCRIGF
jgi:hypothetical protein